jgi:hypothetical protein
MAWPHYYGTPSFRDYLASDIFSSLKTQIFTYFRIECAQANLEALSWQVFTSTTNFILVYLFPHMCRV